MKKEPLFLYLFRLTLIFGIFFFIGMQYWSSNLVETDLKALHLRINQLNDQVDSFKQEMNRLQKLPQTSPGEQMKETADLKRLQMDASLPNLLEEDTFSDVTLPEMLGPHFKPTGTLHQAVLGKPQNLHPFSNWYQVSTWQSLCQVNVARNKFGIYETISPDIGLKMEERINPKTGLSEFWVHLRDQVYWQPLNPLSLPPGFELSPHFLKKHQVTAYDFKFFIDAVMNPYVQEGNALALRGLYEDLESLEVIDPLTFVVRWKHENIVQPDGSTIPRIKYVAKLLTGYLKPLASFVYQYFSDGKKIVDDDTDPTTYRTNSIWAQNFSQHWAKNIIVSCGAWIFDSMTDRQIRFTRNPDHYFPYDALVSQLDFQFKDNPDSIWQEFKILQLDTYDLRSDQLANLNAFLDSPQYKAQAKSGNAIRKLEYVSRAYQFIGWNEAKPFFEDKKVRQALTMAIDRKRIIMQNLNGLGIEINGTFYRYSSEYDESIPLWPYDVQKARLFLEEAGWVDTDGDGIIDKLIDGKRVPFQFSLTYYAKSPIAKAIVEYVATALKEVGISLRPVGVDVSDLSAAFEEKNFDAIMYAWALSAPPDDPRQLWSSAGAKQKGSSNVIGFANAEVDQIINQLQYEYDPEKRKKLYHRFDAIIHDEAPYTFLYTPKNLLVYREYLKGVFVPLQRQDLIPGADVGEPDLRTYWLSDG